MRAAPSCSEQGNTAGFGGEDTSIHSKEITLAWALRANSSEQLHRETLAGIKAACSQRAPQLCLWV